MAIPLKRLRRYLWTLLFLMTPLSVSAQPLDAAFAVFDDKGQVCINDEQGGYSCSPVESSHEERLIAVALGDVNGDSLVDVAFNVFEGFVFGAADLAPQVCLGDESGVFDCNDLPVPASDVAGRDIELADLDADGRMDVVLADANQNFICYGNDPGFTCESGPVPTAFLTQAVAVGDLDGDDAPDLVFVGLTDPLGPETTTRCLATGPRQFSCANAGLGPDGVSVALGDFNGDSFPDVLIGGEENRVCLNDTAGNFSCRPLAETGSSTTISIALGDLNGDQNLDAVLVNFRAVVSQRCLGDGAGSFDCSDLATGSSDARSVAIGEVTGDDSLDLVIAGSPNVVCGGDGRGNFSCDELTLANSLPAEDVALGNLPSAVPPVAPPVPVPALGLAGLLALALAIFLMAIGIGRRITDRH